MAKGLIVRFYVDGVYMKHKSEKEGRPIFEDREFISIIPIGDNKTEVVREVTADDRARFPEEYRRFKDGEQELTSGTPLREWPHLRPAQIKMLQHNNVMNVEHLAQLGDDAIARIGFGTRDLVKAAQAYLAKAKDTGAAQHYAVENDRLKSELAELRQQVAELVAAGGGDEQKRGPGRPRKVA